MGVQRACVAAVLAIAALAACQTDQGAGAPAPSANATMATPPAPTARANAHPASAKPEALFEASDSEPIEFVKVQYNIPRGSRIGVSKGLITQCYGAGPYSDLILSWDGGRTVERDTDLADAFYYAARAAGLDVVGDPRQLFENREDRSRATLAIAAEITRINLDICDHMHWFLEYRLGKLSGAGDMDVVWHVYDKLQRKVIHTEEMTARIELKEVASDHYSVFITEAFAEATRKLTRSAGFRRAVAKADEHERSGIGATASSRAALSLVRTAAFAGPLAQRAEHARRATVTIDLGDGHGSGFVVDARGFILTNQHVVGERERVRVRFFDGTETTGEVLRRDRVRDVALVKIAEDDHPALPIRRAPAAVAEEVYAIGAPLDPSLSNSVTKGVVSAIRRGKRNGLLYIQADVNIQGGNSGGPLVDGSGNVVGISVAGIREEGVMTGVNFFIPIHDALDRLNLRLADGPTS